VDSRFARLVVSERFWFSRGVKALAESEMLGWVVVGLERRDVWRDGFWRKWWRSCVLCRLLDSQARACMDRLGLTSSPEYFQVAILVL
jgi:hypothetical protein